MGVITEVYSHVYEKSSHLSPKYGKVLYPHAKLPTWIVPLSQAERMFRCDRRGFACDRERDEREHEGISAIQLGSSDEVVRTASENSDLQLTNE